MGEECSARSIPTGEKFARNIPADIVLDLKIEVVGTLMQP